MMNMTKVFWHGFKSAFQVLGYILHLGRRTHPDNQELLIRPNYFGENHMVLRRIKPIGQQKVTLPSDPFLRSAWANRPKPKKVRVPMSRRHSLVPDPWW